MDKIYIYIIGMLLMLIGMFGFTYMESLENEKYKQKFIEECHSLGYSTVVLTTWSGHICAEIKILKMGWEN